ncbi:MAG: hypothetical protein KGD72_09420 [Candidatus Lokiarchaeota archaeon]|nr:hypothetical protein [Candidatus Lokiarchaeota archaeon]
MHKRKISYYVAIFFAVFLTIASINVRAHPPDDMSLEYNSNTNTLKVSISHGVSDNTTHYVISVVVRVNGTIDQTEIYTSQPSLGFFIYEYTVIANNESTIQVTATCSQGGSITKTLGGTTTPTDGAIPGYMGLYIVLIVSVITLLMIIRKKFKKIELKQ